MTQMCKKCGYGNPDDTATTCPNCGVVYGKERLQTYLPKTNRHQNESDKKLIKNMATAFIALIALSVIGFFVYQIASKPSEQSMVTGYTAIYIIMVTSIGLLIGKARGRPASGAFFGFLLGPIGWLITLLGPNKTQN